MPMSCLSSSELRCASTAPFVATAMPTSSSEMMFCEMTVPVIGGAPVGGVVKNHDPPSDQMSGTVPSGPSVEF